MISRPASHGDKRGVMRALRGICRDILAAKDFWGDLTQIKAWTSQPTYYRYDVGG